MSYFYSFFFEAFCFIDLIVFFSHARHSFLIWFLQERKLSKRSFLFFIFLGKKKSYTPQQVVGSLIG